MTHVRCNLENGVELSNKDVRLGVGAVLAGAAQVVGANEDGQHRRDITHAHIGGRPAFQSRSKSTVSAYVVLSCLTR